MLWWSRTLGWNKINALQAGHSPGYLDESGEPTHRSTRGYNLLLAELVYYEVVLPLPQKRKISARFPFSLVSQAISVISCPESPWMIVIPIGFLPWSPVSLVCRWWRRMVVQMSEISDCSYIQYVSLQATQLTMPFFPTSNQTSYFRVLCFQES